MATPMIYQFVTELTQRVELPDPIVEFGAMQVEDWQPNDLRPLFAGRDYTGTDFREGPGVDRVEDVRAISYPDGSIGTSICLETIEHCEDPPQACRELARVTADGGVCIVTSVMLFGIHGYPNDYFRFTPEGMRSLLSGFDYVWVGAVGHEAIPSHVFGVGAKGRDLGLRFEDFPSLVRPQREFEAAHGKVRLGVLNYKPSELLRAMARDTPRIVRERLARR